MRISERSVEGQHSRITQIKRNMPNCSVALISFELRYGMLCKSLTSNPRVPQLELDLLYWLKYTLTLVDLLHGIIGGALALLGRGPRSDKLLNVFLGSGSGIGGDIPAVCCS